MPASRLIIERDKERTKQMLADVLAGAKRLPSNIAGMPSDVAGQVGNLGRAAVGYVGGQTGLLRPDQLPELDQRPVLGSDWMAQKAGLPERSGRPAETIGELGAGMLAPGVAMGGAKAAGRGIEALASALESHGAPMAERYMDRMGMAPKAIVYHGSPHQFDEFDASKIGTGEGAQAYGHGIYLADSPEVAKSYSKISPSGIPPSPRRALLGQELQPGTPEYHAATLLSGSGRSLASVRKEVQGWIANARPGEDVGHYKGVLDALGRVASKKDFKELPPLQNFYKADLPDEKIARMLDWDKPLSEQHPDVQAAFLQAQHGGDPILRELLDMSPAGMQVQGMVPTAKGSAAYKTMAEMHGGHDAAAEVLRKAGIPGIRYLDQGSRFTPQAAIDFSQHLDGSQRFTVNGPKGDMHFNSMKEAQDYIEGLRTRNYVVFPGEEKNVKILERNGQLIKALENYKTPAEYGGEHRPPMSGSGAPLHDLTGGGTVYPDDVYSHNAARYYGHGNPEDDVALFRKIHALKGKPDEMVDIFRAVPKEAFVNGQQPPFNHGDWVTISRKYAVEHGESTLNGDYKIMRARVPAKSLFTNGDSPYEFGLDRIAGGIAR